jgi:hypothetical protein
MKLKYDHFIFILSFSPLFYGAFAYLPLFKITDQVDGVPA